MVRGKQWVKSQYECEVSVLIPEASDMVILEGSKLPYGYLVRSTGWDAVQEASAVEKGRVVNFITRHPWWLSSVAM